MRTRAGTKAPVSAIVINDGTWMLEKEGCCGIGRERKKEEAFFSAEINNAATLLFTGDEDINGAPPLESDRSIFYLLTLGRVTRERQKAQLPREEMRGEVLEFSRDAQTTGRNFFRVEVAEKTRRRYAAESAKRGKPIPRTMRRFVNKIFRET